MMDEARLIYECGYCYQRMKEREEFLSDEQVQLALQFWSDFGDDPNFWHGANAAIARRDQDRYAVLNWLIARDNREAFFKMLRLASERGKRRLEAERRKSTPLY